MAPTRQPKPQADADQAKATDAAATGTPADQPQPAPGAPEAPTRQPKPQADADQAKATDAAATGTAGLPPLADAAAQAPTGAPAPAAGSVDATAAPNAPAPAPAPVPVPAPVPAPAPAPGDAGPVEAPDAPTTGDDGFDSTDDEVYVRANANLNLGVPREQVAEVITENLPEGKTLADVPQIISLPMVVGEEAWVPNTAEVRDCLAAGLLTKVDPPADDAD